MFVYSFVQCFRLKLRPHNGFQHISSLVKFEYLLPKISPPGHLYFTIFILILKILPRQAMMKQQQDQHNVLTDCLIKELWWWGLYSVIKIWFLVWHKLFVLPKLELEFPFWHKLLVFPKLELEFLFWHKLFVFPKLELSFAEQWVLKIDLTLA